MTPLQRFRRPAGRAIQYAMALGLILALVACAAPTPAPTAAPTATALPEPAATSTSLPTPTSAPSQTPSPLPPTATATVAPTATETLPPPEPLTWPGGTRPLLLAHYMPWYQTPSVDGAWGWHWTMNHFTPTQAADGSWSGLASHFTPLTGPYSSNDEAVLEYQVMLMKLSGIDGVIVDWYGSDNALDYGSINTATNTLFKVIKKAGLKFAICYEDQTISHLIDNGNFTAADALKHGQAVMSYLQTTWFKDPAYLKSAGQPVLFNFGPQYFKNAGDWQSLFSGLNPKPLLITENTPGVPEAAAAFPWPPMAASVGGVLAQSALKDYLDGFYSLAPYWPYKIGGAFPGFYDIYQQAGVGNSYGFLDAQGDRTFRFTLQEALNSKLDAIQLITWNDYGEGTNIEPTVEYGYRYLEVLQEANRLTQGAKFTYTADNLRLPLAWYQARVKYANDSAALAKLDQAFQAVSAGNVKSAQAIIQGLSQ